MTDFYSKMAGKGRYYAFEPHLNNWNPYPWNHISWKNIFEVTSLICPYSKIPKFTFSRKYLICGLPVEISAYPEKLQIISCYTPWKYEVNRTQTHEMRAICFCSIFLSPHGSIMVIKKHLFYVKNLFSQIILPRAHFRARCGR